MTERAEGTFIVKLTPEPGGNAADAGLGRTAIDKEFPGDLEAMRVTGTLEGRTGTFVLQHSGTMTRGAPELVVRVVPDSGTGELAGLAGRMEIIIADGRHSYRFDYSTAESGA